MSQVTVIKQNEHGEETWRYQGKLLERVGNRIVLEAHFERQDTQPHGFLLAHGDRFVETYFTDRWYNIFEIHAHDDDHLRGWYCNIGFPAKMEGDILSYRDLALDLLVFPDGKQEVLDEEEFARLEISTKTRRQARHALQELQSEFHKKVPARR